MTTGRFTSATTMWAATRRRFVDAQGFTWDEGGHVIFSHYPYFDRLIDRALKCEFHERVRESWIFSRDTWVPYPFQNNLRYLPKEAQVECLLGAAKAAGQSNGGGTENFATGYSPRLAKASPAISCFRTTRKCGPLRPSRWPSPGSRSASRWWTSSDCWRTCSIQRDDVGWGPNSKFKFPLHGGTGEIYRSIGRLWAARPMRQRARRSGYRAPHRLLFRRHRRQVRRARHTAPWICW